MTLTLLHKRIKFAENMSYRYFGLKIHGGYGDIDVYHTQF